MTVHLTPLQAAVYDALPNRQRVEEIYSRFAMDFECPASLLYTAAEVEAWYRVRGKWIRGVQTRRRGAA